MMHRLRKLNQRGDTIVEVLIAMAVVGSIIVAGYVISNRSTSGILEAQERGEALKLAQSQVEQLRTSAAPVNGSCYYLENSGHSGVVAIGNIATDCKTDATGAIGSSRLQYTTTVTQDSATGIFTVQVQWSSALSTNPNSVQLFYKQGVVT